MHPFLKTVCIVDFLEQMDSQKGMFPLQLKVLAKWIYLDIFALNVIKPVLLNTNKNTVRCFSKWDPACPGACVTKLR